MTFRKRLSMLFWKRRQYFIAPALNKGLDAFLKFQPNVFLLIGGKGPIQDDGKTRKITEFQMTFSNPSDREALRQILAHAAVQLDGGTTAAL